jgi:hypothetical protein
MKRQVYKIKAIHNLISGDFDLKFQAMDVLHVGPLRLIENILKCILSFIEAYSLLQNAS